MSIPNRFPSHAEAVKAGWFSRRHETPDAHREEQDLWRMGRAAKRERETESARVTAERKAERDRIKVS